MEQDAANSAQDILEGLNVDVTRILPIPEKAHDVAHIKGADAYLQMYRDSIEDTAGFWDKVRHFLAHFTLNEARFLSFSTRA